MSNGKIFRNIGLIRDNNLSDIKNQRESLSNVLNDLVSSDDLSFEAKDLDAIQNISTTNVTAGAFQKLSGITLEQSALNQNGDVILETASPFVTIKNRVDAVIQTTDDPPFFNGGDGLNAKFWSQDKISDTLDKDSNGDDVFTASEDLIKTQFWETGFFEFSGSIDDTLAGSNGGIQWDGFYIPSVTGDTTFSFNTSGLLMLELENASGVLEVAKSIYSEEITLTALSDVNGGNTVPISKEDYKFAAIGGSINPLTLQQVQITDVIWDFETGSYSLELNSGVNLNQGENFTVSYAARLGTESFRVQYPFRSLPAFEPRRIRLTYWFPGNENYVYKVLDSNFSTSNFSGDLQFWNLYSTVNTDTDSDTFKNFFENRLLNSGGRIGPFDVDSSEEYEEVSTISPLFIAYDPPATFSDTLRVTHTYSRDVNSRVLSTTGTSPFTTNVEIGNLVIGEGIPLNSFVTDITTNSVVVLNQEVTLGTTGEVTFVDHRGLVRTLEATSNASTVTIDDTSLLKEGMIVITTDNSDYIRITSVINGTDFSTDTELNLTGTEVIYIYLDKGLENRTLENFCIGVLGKETAGGTGVVVNQGSAIVPLNNVDDIVTNMVVQSTGFIPDSTVVQSIDTTNSTVTLSNNVLEDMIAGITVVFAPEGTTLNKEQCIIPLNTAPPFTGTDTGLSTENNVSLLNPNSQLNVVSLTANNIPVTELSDSTPPFDKKIEIQVKEQPFYILGSTS